MATGHIISIAGHDCLRARAIKSAGDTFRTYADAFTVLADRLDGSFPDAVTAILATRGRVIVIGMGKSGIIGKKIAATGTPSFFIHPADAVYGDLGMITPDDLVILISYSGETEEILRILPSLRGFGIRRIAMVGSMQSTLARNCDIVLDVSVRREACPHNLAPTTSTVVTLAMGDALAVSLIEERGFRPLDFATFHPGGALGRRLLTRVGDVMHTRNLPIVSQDEPMQDVIVAMTRGRLGLAIIMESGKLAGIITDGDLRRSLTDHQNIKDLRAAEVMTRSPLIARVDDMWIDAETRMTEAKVSTLIVLDASDHIVGVVQIYDKA
jgi:arabinose-5-phosphate isomerase